MALVSRENRQEEHEASLLCHMCKVKLKVGLGHVGQRWRTWPRKEEEPLRRQRQAPGLCGPEDARLSPGKEAGS